MNKFESNNITGTIHKLMSFVPKSLSMAEEFYQTRFVDFLRNTCNNTPKNASALYTPTDAFEGGIHLCNQCFAFTIHGLRW